MIPRGVRRKQSEEEFRRLTLHCRSEYRTATSPSRHVLPSYHLHYRHFSQSQIPSRIFRLHTIRMASISLRTETATMPLGRSRCSPTITGTQRTQRSSGSFDINTVTVNMQYGLSEVQSLDVVTYHTKPQASNGAKEWDYPGKRTTRLV